jgi:hypothetical protein
MEQYRLRNGEYGSDPYDDFGAFEVTGPCGQTLRILVSSGNIDLDIPWEHVSVSLRNRCPNWTEMCFIKDMFWDEEDTVMQLHPPKSQYVNNHPYCLHLWRPTRVDIPLPPQITVGIAGVVADAQGRIQ